MAKTTLKAKAPVKITPLISTPQVKTTAPKATTTPTTIRATGTAISGMKPSTSSFTQGVTNLGNKIIGQQATSAIGNAIKNPMGIAKNVMANPGKATANVINAVSSVIPKPPAYVKPQVNDNFPSFGEFASPQMAEFEKLRKDVLEPQFKTYTYDPAQRALQNSAAANNMGQQGYAPTYYANTLNPLIMDQNARMYSQREQLRQQIMNDYMQRYGDYYSSPTYLDSMMTNNFTDYNNSY